MVAIVAGAMASAHNKARRMFCLFQSAKQPTGSPLLRSQIAIVEQRHARALPAQRVHDAGKILPAGEEVLIDPNPGRMRADLLELAGEGLGIEVAESAAL